MRSGGVVVVDRPQPVEAAEVLGSLLDRHPELVGEAEELAAAIVTAIEAEDIADEVAEAVTAPGYEELNARAGRHQWGYTEPSDAAWEIVEEALQPFLDDLKRLIELGFEAAATETCRGIVTGLYRIKDRGDDRVLGWAPDFPPEGAGEAVHTLAAESVARHGRKWTLPEALLVQVPGWNVMLERAAREAGRHTGA